MKISRQAIRDYQKQVDRQADAARDYMSRALDAYMRQYPDASVAQMRKFTYELMQDALPNFTDLAETLSCDFMEAVAEEHGWDDVKPEIIGSTDYKMVDKRLHYLAGHLTNGDTEKYREGVLDVTRFYIKRSAQDAMVANCDKARLRYARVPSGFETCAFCFMLASRGFVYSSELKAGLGHSYHPNCNCTVVPGAKGRTAIDGYDPEGMYKRWEDCAKTVGSYDADAVMKEAATRDWHWLYTGVAPKAIYEKPRAELMEHERKGVDHLLKHGIRVKVVKEISSAAANIDFELFDKSYELKNITNGSSASNQVKRARIKWWKLKRTDKMRAVFTTENTDIGFQETVDEVEKRLRLGEEAIVVSENGESIIRLKK